MNWWTRFRSWLARVVSPATRIEVVPEDQCIHHVATDPEATMHRLVAAVVDPLRFGEELAVFSNCAGCSMAVLANMACTLAGIAVVDQSDDEPGEYECEHALNPEVVAMGLVLTRKSRDGTVLGSTLAKFDTCPHCVGSVVLCLLNAHVSVLDHTGVDWEPMVQRHLESLLPPGRS